MVARQLMIVSQSDAFMISTTRNKQYVLKKLAGLIVFEKDIFNIYLNNICHIVLLLYLVRKCLVNTDCMRCLATKQVKISQIFKYMMIVLPWKQNNLFQTRNLIFLWVCLCMQYCISIIRQLFFVFYKNCVNVIIGGVNYRT